MRLRAIALGLFGLAAGLFLGVTLPARSEAAATGDAYRRARDARRAATLRLERASRRDAAWQRLTALASAPESDAADAVTRLRRDVLGAVRGVRVSGVRLSVRPAHAPAAASLSLSTQGSLSETTRLSAALTGPGGLILEQVRLLPEGGGREVRGPGSAATRQVVRRRLLATALLVGLGLVAGTRGAPPVLPELGQRIGREAPTMVTVVPSIPALARNPFEYADAAQAAEPRASAVHVEPAAAVATPAPVRLAGFVTQAGRLRAALVVHGQLTLLAVGESAEGYTLLVADEEVGARLKGPDGEIEIPVQ